MIKTEDLPKQNWAGNVRFFHADVTVFNKRTPVFFSFSIVQFFPQHGGVATATTALQVGTPAAVPASSLRFYAADRIFWLHFRAQHL